MDLRLMFFIIIIFLLWSFAISTTSNVLDIIISKNAIRDLVI